MTDKQIIIDGEQCQYLSNTGLCRLIYNLSEKSYDCSMCNENHNCYYKQLKRKEQECEELKETFDDLFKGQYKLADNCKKLRQCLTEIKEIIHFNKTNRLSGGADISIEQILQKISECEVD